MTGLLPFECEPWADPSVVMSGGPTRVAGEPDPDYVPPPFLGFAAPAGPPRCPYPVRDDGTCSHHLDNVCGGSTPRSCGTCLACTYTEVRRLGWIKIDIVRIPCEEHRRP